MSWQEARILNACGAHKTSKLCSDIAQKVFATTIEIKIKIDTKLLIKLTGCKLTQNNTEADESLMKLGRK